MSFLDTLAPSFKVHTTTIGGVDYPIHEMSAQDWFDLMQPLREKAEDLTPDEMVKRTCEVVIKGMDGVTTKVSKAQIEQLHKKMTNGHITEYIHRLNSLNDYGLDTLRVAEKNSETTLSSDTESS